MTYATTHRPCLLKTHASAGAARGSDLCRKRLPTPVEQRVIRAKGGGRAQKVCDQGRWGLKADAPAVEGRGQVAVAVVSHLSRPRGASSLAPSAAVSSVAKLCRLPCTLQPPRFEENAHTEACWARTQACWARTRVRGSACEECEGGRDRPRELGTVGIGPADPLAVPRARVVVGKRADGLVHVQHLLRYQIQIRRPRHRLCSCLPTVCPCAQARERRA
jgi:hypothetical protein